jgi:ribosome-associated toxin RatA of RatAB toxin-antitoxin module
MVSFYQIVNDIKKFGSFLDFIQDNSFFVRIPQDNLSEPLGSSLIAAKDIRLQQIDEERLRAVLFKPSRFTSSPWAKEKIATSVPFKIPFEVLICSHFGVHNAKYGLFMASAMPL